MGETSIEWTDFTFNPWRGCARVSPGCEHCYAEAFAKRVGFTGKARPSGKPMLPLLWGAKAAREPASESMWRQPAKWDREAKALGIRRKVFCASMADVFEQHGDAETSGLLATLRARLFRVIESTPNLDWLLLTKRPENMVAMARAAGWLNAWPSNVWAGTTCEDQRRARERVPHLLAVPAKIRFVSYEPALDSIDFTDLWLGGNVLAPECWGDCACDSLAGYDPGCRRNGGDGSLTRKIDWVIVGGESGPGARIFDAAYARSVVEQCREAGVAAFVKQMGSNPIDSDSGGLAPWNLRDAKGGDWSEWPEDIRVREWPEVQP